MGLIATTARERAMAVAVGSQLTHLHDIPGDDDDDDDDGGDDACADDSPRFASWNFPHKSVRCRFGTRWPGPWDTLS